MGVYNTNTFAGTAGSAWPNASNGDVWTYTNIGNAHAVAPADTVNGSNVGEDLATPNANTANASGRIFRVGSTTHSDSQVTCVIKRSDVGFPSSAGFGNLRPGVILRKTATTTQTYYVAMLDYYAQATKGGTVYIGGVRIWRYNAATATSLFIAMGQNILTDLATASNSFVLQFRVTNAPNTSTGALLQARAWTGSNPASPPAGAEWVSTSGTINGSTNYVSGAYLDTAPLAAGTGGLWVMRAGGTAASTASYSQYEYRTVAAQSASASTTPGATFARAYALTRQLAATVAGAPAFVRNITDTLTATAGTAATIAGATMRQLTLATTSTVAAVLSWAANVTNYTLTLAATLAVAPTITRQHARNLAATITTTATTIRAAIYARTITTATTVAATIRKNRDLVLGAGQTLAATLTRSAAYQRTVAALTTLTPTVTVQAAYYRTLAVTATAAGTVRRAFVRTLTTTATAAPVMTAQRVAALIVQHLRGPLLARLTGARRAGATIVSPPETTADVITTGGHVEVLD